MKYIRTKDGIYEVLHTWLDEDIDMNKYDTTDGVIDSIEIEKDANTIEELCDEFVAIRKSDKEKLHLCYWNWKDIVEECWKNDTAIDLYGAIWTDKGLIYVAKTNDKGELELL